MYQKLNREEKKIIRNKYKATKKGSNLIILYNRVLIDSLSCLSCAIAIIVFINQQIISSWFYILVVILFIAFLVFLISSYILRIKEYNNFMTKSKK